MCLLLLATLFLLFEFEGLSFRLCLHICLLLLLEHLGLEFYEIIRLEKGALASDMRLVHQWIELALASLLSEHILISLGVPSPRQRIDSIV
mmetsp:Transcript_1814/g.2602  ORF Transcript_1814/g.2602 Transcript_1814/m.2602 type:complete len:91 (-) Transcript_1814:573-845(-)